MMGQRVTLAGLGLSLCMACSTGGDGMATSVQAQPAVKTAACAKAQAPRCVVVISDLHFGVGKDTAGNWDPTEDFRWSAELKSFLDMLGVWGGGKVDLVIAGDLMELWQPPDNAVCQSKAADYGCTVQEMERITSIVVKAHRSDFEGLGSFADSGNNRLVLIPGNHDAALLLPGVWKQVKEAVNSKMSNRVILAINGVWVSDDGAVISEHGHQIGKEVNKWETWPRILGTNPKDGKDYLVRPWGELFVQSRFNEREQKYPIIDNLSPESAGIRYYMADHGLGDNIGDIASFLKFNIVETSLSQEASFLGEKPEPGSPPKWDLPWARQEYKHLLFAYSLSATDPFRQELLSSKDKQWDDLRTTLDKLVQDSGFLPDDELKKICAQLAIRAVEENRTKVLAQPSEGTKTENEGATCHKPEQGYLAQKLFVPRNWIMEPYLNDRVIDFPDMKTFVYGHTHELDFDWSLKLVNGRTVSIFNTGAFQRVIDDETFLAQAKAAQMAPSEALKQKDLAKALPPCYSVVLVDYKNGEPRPLMNNWYVDDNGTGMLVAACDARCAKMSKKCKK